MRAGTAVASLMGTRTLTAVDLREKLSEQLGFLRASMAGYDAGSIAEAKRLATSIRVLVHDAQAPAPSGKSKRKLSISLLTLLGIKNYPWLDTSIGRHSFHNTGFMHLVAVSAQGRYVPFLDRPDVPDRFISFPRWWRGVVLFDGRDDLELTREKAVLGAANQDGGAHVDPELNETYARFLNDNPFSLYRGHGDGAFRFGGRPPPPEDGLTGAIHASIRQIAHEVLRTLEHDFRQQTHLMAGDTIALPWMPGIYVNRGPLGVPRPCICQSGKAFPDCHGKVDEDP
jgi:hypothetical protein